VVATAYPERFKILHERSYIPKVLSVFGTPREFSAEVIFTDLPLVAFQLSVIPFGPVKTNRGVLG
jgi:hypothetical protein